MINYAGISPCFTDITLFKYGKQRQWSWKNGQKS